MPLCRPARWGKTSPLAGAEIAGTSPFCGGVRRNSSHQGEPLARDFDEICRSIEARDIGGLGGAQ